MMPRTQAPPINLKQNLNLPKPHLFLAQKNQKLR
jgi:hypothetical protein